MKQKPKYLTNEKKYEPLLAAAPCTSIYAY